MSIYELCDLRRRRRELMLGIGFLVFGAYLAWRWFG